MKTEIAEKKPFYRHVDIFCSARTKNGQNACGDSFAFYKDEEAVFAVLADGIGSGVKANIASQMACAELSQMLKLGFSLREACAKVAGSMHKARQGGEVLFAAFTAVRILNTGSATVVTYESPAPAFIKNGRAFTPSRRYFAAGGEVVGESRIKLEAGDAIAVMSDGVTQAGIGHGLAFGWKEEGVVKFLNEKISAGFEHGELSRLLTSAAAEISAGAFEDDTTAALLTCRKGRVMNVLTGPPVKQSDDKATVERFFGMQGLKVVCGSTTADIVSRESGKVIDRQKIYPAFNRPPRYYMNGVDVVTEGAVVLNQLYNILEVEDNKLDPESCVTEIAVLMRACDVIKFYVGGAENPGHGDVIFKQLGIIPRRKIVEFIADKLRAAGKLVTVETI